MKILYEGADIYPDVSVHRCYHDMYAEKQSDELLLKLNDTRELWASWNPKKGDTIAIDIPNHSITLKVSDEELAARKAKWVCPEPKIKTGYLARYAKLVSSADKGAILE